MGRDGHPKERNLDRQARKENLRASYARVLIVTEGRKTEPLYLEEIRAAHRLHSANVAIQPSQLGTAPKQVVAYARDLFKNGDPHRGIPKRAFDQIYAVFDRDDHSSYFDALSMAAALDGTLLNDIKERVVFKAIASVPSFELWLLLHYVDIQAPIHRDVVMHQLKQFIPNYDKGMRNVFSTTRADLVTATQRAQKLASQNTPHDGNEPYTGIADLVSVLTTLRG